MKLQTIVDIKPSGWKIGYEDKILMLGSCFSDEIGEQMKQRNLQVTCNPFGTLYNPLSIANAINYKLQITNCRSWNTTVSGIQWRTTVLSPGRPKRKRKRPCGNLSRPCKKRSPKRQS